MRQHDDADQDTDIFALKSSKNKQALVRAARKIGFDLSETEEREIHADKDLVQLRNGPFDLDVIFSPDGIDSFEKAWSKGRDINGYKVCSLDDIIASKKSANRTKDRESLARLDDFRQYLQIQGRSPGKPLPPPANNHENRERWLNTMREVPYIHTVQYGETLIAIMHTIADYATNWAEKCEGCNSQTDKVDTVRSRT